MVLCPKCGNNHFEATVESVKNLNIQVAFIKCGSCNAAIGVLDITTTDNIKDILKKLE